MMYDYEDFNHNPRNNNLHRVSSSGTMENSIHQANHGYNLRKRKLRPFVPSDDEFITEIHPPHKQVATCEPDKGKSDKMYLVWIIASLFTRLLFINSSTIVVWDEAHFGKFANYYMNRTFYFDVHPPLGKMLIALSGWMFNYDGSFAFESGSVYDEKVPVLQMRAFCAILGSFIVPLIYGTCRNLKYSREVSSLVAMSLLFDNALLTISKFILLDSILLCFTAMSLYSITRFEREGKRPFTRQWYIWSIMTGISLGMVLSVKWVGLFTYCFVGAFVIRQLWSMLPIIKREPMVYGKHVMSRALTLIALPMAIYMFTFYVHFAILNRSGPGDAQMSSRFQATLIGSKIRTGPPHVVVDASLITLRNHGHGGGLLHSHAQTYPVGSKQGQVTLYHHQDNNNYFKVMTPWGKDADHEMLPSGTIKLFNNRKDGRLPSGVLQNGDVVRFSHNNTGRNLHSHMVAAPISVYQNEVSAYGNTTIGDEKDHWMVEVVGSDDFDPIVRLETTFRLRHQVLGCYLASSGSRLPEWGFSQMEVICTNMPSRNADWNIEENVVLTSLHYEMGPPKKRSFLKRFRHFVSDFIDLNVAMWNGNNALTPKLGKKDLLISTPSQWPFLQVGLRMCNWKDETVKYYLLGNPVVWWMGALSVLWWMMEFLYIRAKEKTVGFLPREDSEHVNGGTLLALGWFLHYYPFQIMGRVTYLHHYFPALMMSTLLFGHQMKVFSSRRIVLCLSMIIAFTFIYMAPLSYGFIGKANDIVRGRRWRSSWNMVDD